MIFSKSYGVVKKKTPTMFFVLGLLFSVLYSCSSHRLKSYQIPPGDIHPDTLRITHFQARKSQKKVLVIFQTPEAEINKTFLKAFHPWKKRGYDLFVLDYPHPENAIMRKALSGVHIRSADYAHALRPFLEREYRFVYYGMSHACVYALALSDNIRPDYMVFFRAAPVIPPLENFRLILENDTLSVDKDWQPVDASKDKKETFSQLNEAVTNERFSGLLEFDGFNENFWAEANSFNYTEKIFKAPSYFILKENDPNISKTAYHIFQELFNSGIFIFDHAEEELVDVHRRLLGNMDENSRP
jgi:hypothetical protein